jgi:hypothetical protein
MKGSSIAFNGKWHQIEKTPNCVPLSLEVGLLNICQTEVSQQSVTQIISLILKIWSHLKLEPSMSLCSTNRLQASATTVAVDFCRYGKRFLLPLGQKMLSTVLVAWLGILE